MTSRKTASHILNNLPNSYNGAYSTQTKTLIVSGNNTSENIKKIIEDYFGVFDNSNNLYHDTTPNEPRLDWEVKVGLNQLVIYNNENVYNVVTKNLKASRYDGIYRIKNDFTYLQNNWITLEIIDTTNNEILRFLPKNFETELHGYLVTAVSGNSLINSYIKSLYGDSNSKQNLSPGYKSLLYLKDDLNFTNTSDCYDASGNADTNGEASFNSISSSIIEAEEFENKFLQKMAGTIVTSVTVQAVTSNSLIFSNTTGSKTIKVMMSSSEFEYNSNSNQNGFDILSPNIPASGYNSTSTNTISYIGIYPSTIKYEKISNLTYSGEWYVSDASANFISKITNPSTNGLPVYLNNGDSWVVIKLANFSNNQISVESDNSTSLNGITEIVSNRVLDNGGIPRYHYKIDNGTNNDLNITKKLDVTLKTTISDISNQVFSLNIHYDLSTNSQSFIEASNVNLNGVYESFSSSQDSNNNISCSHKTINIENVYTVTGNNTSINGVISTYPWFNYQNNTSNEIELFKAGILSGSVKTINDGIQLGINESLSNNFKLSLFKDVSTKFNNTDINQFSSLTELWNYSFDYSNAKHRDNKTNSSSTTASLDKDKAQLCIDYTNQYQGNILRGPYLNSNSDFTTGWSNLLKDKNSPLKIAKYLSSYSAVDNSDNDMVNLKNDFTNYLNINYDASYLDSSNNIKDKYPNLKQEVSNTNINTVCANLWDNIISVMNNDINNELKISIEVIHKFTGMNEYHPKALPVNPDSSSNNAWYAQYTSKLDRNITFSQNINPIDFTNNNYKNLEFVLDVCNNLAVVNKLDLDDNLITDLSINRAYLFNSQNNGSVTVNDINDVFPEVNKQISLFLNSVEQNVNDTVLFKGVVNDGTGTGFSYNVNGGSNLTVYFSNNYYFTYVNDPVGSIKIIEENDDAGVIKGVVDKTYWVPDNKFYSSPSNFKTIMKLGDVSNIELHSIDLSSYGDKYVYSVKTRSLVGIKNTDWETTGNLELQTVSVNDPTNWDSVANANFSGRPFEYKLEERIYDGWTDGDIIKNLASSIGFSVNKSKIIQTSENFDSSGIAITRLRFQKDVDWNLLQPSKSANTNPKLSNSIGEQIQSIISFDDVSSIRVSTNFKNTNSYEEVQIMARLNNKNLIDTAGGISSLYSSKNFKNSFVKAKINHVPENYGGTLLRTIRDNNGIHPPVGTTIKVYDNNNNLLNYTNMYFVSSNNINFVYNYQGGSNTNVNWSTNYYYTWEHPNDAIIRIGYWNGTNDIQIVSNVANEELITTNGNNGLSNTNSIKIDSSIFAYPTDQVINSNTQTNPQNSGQINITLQGTIEFTNKNDIINYFNNTATQDGKNLGKLINNIATNSLFSNPLNVDVSGSSNWTFGPITIAKLSTIDILKGNNINNDNSGSAVEILTHNTANVLTNCIYDNSVDNRVKITIPYDELNIHTDNSESQGFGKVSSIWVSDAKYNYEVYPNISITLQYTNGYVTGATTNDEHASANNGKKDIYIKWYNNGGSDKGYKFYTDLEGGNEVLLISPKNGSSYTNYISGPDIEGNWVDPLIYTIVVKPFTQEHAQLFEGFTETIIVSNSTDPKTLQSQLLAIGGSKWDSNSNSLIYKGSIGEQNVTANNGQNADDGAGFEQQLNERINNSNLLNFTFSFS